MNDIRANPDLLLKNRGGNAGQAPGTYASSLAMLPVWVKRMRC